MSGWQAEVGQISDVDVSRETEGRLQDFVRLLEKWNSRINLVSPSTIATVWDRHITDSLALASAAPEGALSWADLGSGGGLPGLVIAILYPELRVSLVESDKRKAAFLLTVRRELDLNVEVLAKRIEDANPLGADVVSARALAPLPKLIDYAMRHGSRDSVFLFPKGETWRAEYDEACLTWSFDFQALDGATGSPGKILRLTNVRQTHG
ncbi:MAG: 16S rRNA (guanine(527)-N(7))-methyltransferase RsmG [Jannaschia sp.]